MTGVTHTPVSIDDGNACTADSCDPATGVTHTLLTDDGDPCTADACDPVLGVRHVPIPGCGGQNTGGMPILAGNPLAQEIPQAPSAGGPVVTEHTGALSYGYTFELPAARGRYQPVLSLAYSSGSTADEGYGMGWSLSASYVEADISPTPTSVSDTAPVRYWLSLNGGRILLVPIGGGRYQPETISSWVELTYASGVWTAVDSVGNSYRFSTYFTGASGHGGRWYLTRVTDVDANAAEFTYLRDGSGAAAHVDQIRYNQFASGWATRIDLQYEQMLPERFVPVAGTISNRSWYLKRVLVQNQGSQSYVTTRGYELGYFDYGSALARTKVLNRVTVFGRDPGPTLPPTTFEYGTGTAAEQAYSLQQGRRFSDPASSATMKAWADMDGDSRADRVWKTSSSSRMFWARNVTPPGADLPAFEGAAEIPGSEEVWVAPEPESPNLTLQWPSVFRDFDGDGLGDFIHSSQESPVVAVTIRFGKLVDGAPEFGPAEPISIPSAMTLPSYSQSWERHTLERMSSTTGTFSARLTDVNGDGVLDFAGGAYYCKAFLGHLGASGWGFSDSSRLGTQWCGLDDDVNADGRYDRNGASDRSQWFLGEPRSMSPIVPIAPFPDESSYNLPIPSGWYDCYQGGDLNFFADHRSKSAFVDLNGDGFADKVYKTGAGQLAIGDCQEEPCPLSIFWGTPSGATPAGLLSLPLTSSGSVADIYPAAQMVSDAHVTCEIERWIANGQIVTYDHVVGRRLQPGWDGEFIDMNADGVADYVTSQFGLTFFAGTNGTSGMDGIKIRPVLLQAVVTAGGARYDVTYAPATVFGASFRDASPYVVTAVTISQPGDGTIVPTIAPNTTNHWYADPTKGDLWFEPVRKEPRGFARTWSQDAVGRVVRSVTWATGSHVFAGSPVLIEWGTPSGQPLASGAPGSSVFRRASYTYATRKAGGSSCHGHTVEAPASAYPLVRITTDFTLTDMVDGYSLTSRRSKECSAAAVDDFGNTRVASVDLDTARVGDEYLEVAAFDTAATCKTCVTQTRTIAGDSGPVLEDSRYQYDPRWHRISVSRWVTDGAGSRFETDSVTNYNSDGTVASRVTGPVTESFTYDAQQLRVTTTTRSDGAATLATTTTYDPETGHVRTQEGPYVPGSTAARPTTAYAYDTFGRVIAVGRSLSGSSVNQALSATRYLDNVPPSVVSYSFAAPLSLSVASDLMVGSQSIDTRADVKKVVSYMDGLGRVVQVRERLGSAGSADSIAGIVSQLSGYRVSGVVKIDGAGRTVASLEPFHDSSPAFKSLDAIAGDGTVRRGATTWFDARGWTSCSMAGVYSAIDSESDGATCSSSFDDTASFRLSTRYLYRGLSRDGRNYVGVEIIPPSSGIRGTESIYGTAGRLDRTVDAFGNETVFSYDLLGRRTSVTRLASGMAAGQTTTTSYDNLGRVIEEWDPNWSPGSAPSKVYTYDQQGRVTRVGLPEKDLGSGYKARPELRYEYQSLGRVTRVYAREPSYVAGAGVTYTERTISTTAYDTPYAGSSAYAYTAGQVSSVTAGPSGSPTTTIAFGYDQNGTAVRRDQWLVGLSGAFTAVLVPSNDGRVLSTTFESPYSKPVTSAYAYDTALRPTAIQVGSTFAWEAVSADSFGSYDPAGRVGHVRSNGGTVNTIRTYGTFNPELISHAVGTSATQVYGVGNLIYAGGKLQQFQDTTTQTSYGFTYDANGRLVRAVATPSVSGGVAQSFDEGYSFSDPAMAPNASFGNLEQVRTFGADGSQTTRDYEYSDDRVTGIRIGASQEKSYQYDEAGRLLLESAGASSRTASYDVEGHLKTVQLSDGTGEILEYDHAGALMSRRVGTKVHYYLDGFATVTGDVASSCAGYGCAVTNANVAVHVLLGDTRIASVRAPPPGSSAAIDSDILYYYRDRTGSIIATTVTGGLIGERYRYLPYGALDKVEVVTGNATSELGYTGALKLSGSLIHLSARVYDTELKRFLQPDAVDALRFTYAAGDPIGLVDPTGQLPMDPAMHESGDPTPMPGLVPELGGPQRSLVEALLAEASEYERKKRALEKALGDRLKSFASGLPDGCSVDEEGTVTCKAHVEIDWEHTRYAPVLDSAPANFVGPNGWEDWDVQAPADFIMGLGDALTFGGSAWVREQLGLGQFAHKYSGAYEAGELASFAFGAGRLAYAGAAKAIPLLARGATPWIRAYRAVGLRNELKLAFRFGLSQDRVYGLGQMVAKYGPNPQAIISAASRTSSLYNLWGASYFAQGP